MTSVSLKFYEIIKPTNMYAYSHTWLSHPESSCTTDLDYQIAISSFKLEMLLNSGQE